MNVNPAINEISNGDCLLSIRLENLMKENTKKIAEKISKDFLEKKDITSFSNSIHNILINSILPFVFFYGKQKNEEQYCHLALDILKEKIHCIS